MRAGTFLFTLASLLLIATVAQANPMTTQVLRARQVYETHHVQITYGVDTGIGEELKTPTEVQRDGVAISADWQLLTSSYTTNTGSGLAGVAATQFCDCAVPLGEHAYQITVPPNGSTLSTTVTVVDNLLPPDDSGDPLDAGSADAEEIWPWDIPEPTNIQGLDCVTACEDDTPPDQDLDVGAAGDDTPDAGTVEDAGAVDAGPAPDAAASTDTPGLPDSVGALVDSGGGSGSSGSGGVQTTNPPEEDEDAGCLVARRSGHTPWLTLSLCVGLMVLRRRKSAEVNR